jgi:hypothetical protein
VTVLRQQVIPEITIGNATSNCDVRMIRLTDNSVLVIKNDKTNINLKNMNVLHIDPVTNVISVGVSSDFDLYTQVNSWNFYANGVAITGITETDNSVIVAYRTGFNQAILARVSYDPNTNSLSKSTIHTFTFHTVNPAFSNLGFTKTPNGVMLYSAVSTTTAQSAGITKMFYVGLGSSTATVFLDVAFTGSLSDIRRKTYIPFTDTTGVFTNSAAIQFCNNGSLSQSVAITNATGPGNSYCSYSLKLSDGYFVSLSVDANATFTSEQITNVSRGFRVVKYTDPNYAICSPASVGATNTQSGVVIPAANLWMVEMPMLDLVDDSLIIIPTIASSTSFGFKTLWIS